MGALAKGSTQRPNIPNPRFPNRPQAALGQRVPAAPAPQATSGPRIAPAVPRAQRGVQYTPAVRKQPTLEEGIERHIQDVSRLQAEADAAKARSQHNRMAGQGSGPEVR